MAKVKHITIFIILIVFLIYFNFDFLKSIYGRTVFMYHNADLTKEQKLVMKVKEYRIVLFVQQQSKKESITLVLPADMQGNIDEGVIVGLLYPQKIRFIYK